MSSRSIAPIGLWPLPMRLRSVPHGGRLEQRIQSKPGFATNIFTAICILMHSSTQGATSLESYKPMPCAWIYMYSCSFRIHRYIGVYVQTLIIILWRDIIKFLSMFAVVLVVLSGPLYLSLRYDADLTNSTTLALLSGEVRWDEKWSMNTQCMFSEAIWKMHTVITLSCQPETNYPNKRILYTVMSIRCMVGYVLILQ